MPVMNEIEKRQAKRKDIAKRLATMCPPLITDTESRKDYNKKVDEMQSNYLDAWTMGDVDIDRLRWAIRELLKGDDFKIDELMGRAATAMPIDLDTRRKMELQELREREVEKKKLAKLGKGLAAVGATGGDQKTIFDQLEENDRKRGPKDDGSVAEGGPVTVSKA